MASPAAGLPRSSRRRLSASADFNRVYRRGRSFASRHLVLYAFARPEAEGPGRRLGVSVNRKVGGSVARSRVKRLLREAFWRAEPRLPGQYDVVLVARPSLQELGERGGEQAVQQVVEELVGKLLDARPEPPVVDPGQPA